MDNATPYCPPPVPQKAGDAEHARENGHMTEEQQPATEQENGPTPEPQPGTDAPASAPKSETPGTDVNALAADPGEPEADDDVPRINNSGWLTRTFSFKGRITRAEFALSHAALALLPIVTGTVGDLALIIDDAAGMSIRKFFALSCLLAFCWFYTSQGVKRCHDTGRTGWLFFIPFYNIYLLFARPAAEPNRYGTQATIHTATAEDRVRCTRTRGRGALCALGWLAFSPLYLWLAWRWQLQKSGKRLLLFLISPFILCAIGITWTLTHDAAAKHKETETIRECISRKITSLQLEVADIEKTGRGTYALTLKRPLTESDVQLLERATRSLGEWTKTERPDEEEDYGYYEEDCGSGADSTAQAAQPVPPTYRFDKTVRLTGREQPLHVSLEVTPGETEARLTLRRTRKATD